LLSSFTDCSFIGCLFHIISFLEFSLFSFLVLQNTGMCLFVLDWIIQGPPTSGGTKKAAATKRKKGGKGKGKDGQGTAGEILVMPFLSQFPVPDDGAAPSSEQVLKYVYQLMFPIHGVSSLLQPHKILLASKHCLFAC
jgi:hypothetical protein